MSKETFEEAVVTHKVHPSIFEVIGHHPSPKLDLQDSFRNDSLKSEDAGGPGASGTYVVRVTLVWAPLGSRRGHPLDHDLALTTAVQEWAAAATIPDVIVVGECTRNVSAVKKEDSISLHVFRLFLVLYGWHSELPST